jgi:hypothetical protein
MLLKTNGRLERLTNQAAIQMKIKAVIRLVRISLKTKGLPDRRGFAALGTGSF